MSYLSSKKEEEKRGFILIFLWISYLLAELIVPTIAMIGINFSMEFKTNQTGWAGASRLMLLFVSVPVYVIYGFIMLKDHFPRQIKKALYVMFPLLINTLFFLYSLRTNGWFTFVSQLSFSFYIGLNLCFAGGLVVLILGRMHNDGIKQIAGKLIATLIIMFFLFAPVGTQIALMIELTETISASRQAFARNLALQLLAVGDVVYFSIPLLVGLYHKGKL